MNIKALFPLLVLTALITGCNTMKVTSEYDQSYDFSTVKTYQWIDGPAEILDTADTYINGDIQTALNNELNKNGLRAASDTSTADIHVAYYVKLKEESEYTKTNQHDRDFSGGFVYNREKSSWSYDEREPDLNIYTIETGTLTLLAYDTKTGKRIWKGNLKTEIDRSRPRGEQQERIRNAAEKLMKRFPKTSE